MAEDASHTNVIAPDAVKWTENPAFPKGIQIATLVGDPTKAGETVVQRIKFPPKLYNAAAHPSLLGGPDGHQRQYRDEVARSLRRTAACCSQDQCGCTRQSTRTMHEPEMERPSCRSSTPARAASSTSTRLTIHARFDDKPLACSRCHQKPGGLAGLIFCVIGCRQPPSPLLMNFRPDT